MQKLLYMSIIAALLAAGWGSLHAPNQLSELPLRYHNTQYGLTFCLPGNWQGYSALIQPWEGVMYSPLEDRLIVVGHGLGIVFRHPQWKASAPYQDILFLVLPRSQWDALHQGKLWPSLYAGGVMSEMWHNLCHI